jgi:hypothetical protein
VGKTRDSIVSSGNELTKQNSELRDEMIRRSDSIESRISSIESRIDDLAKSIEIRHADLWKLLIDMNNSLPISVMMSTSEVIAKTSAEIKSDIADTRVEISGLLMTKKSEDD